MQEGEEVTESLFIFFRFSLFIVFISKEEEKVEGGKVRKERREERESRGKVEGGKVSSVIASIWSIVFLSLSLSQRFKFKKAASKEKESILRNHLFRYPMASSKVSKAGMA